MTSISPVKRRSFLSDNMKHFLLGYFTEYETPKVVLIHSAKFAILLRGIQIIILIYSVLYLLLYERGYQQSSTTIIASVALKVKGIGHINEADNQSMMIIDGADYIIPPTENSAIFIMTNFIETDQTRSKCAESSTLPEAICRTDSDCLHKSIGPNVNGRWTGRCLLPKEVNDTHQMANLTKSSKGLCEYLGWCPPESDLSPSNLVHGIFNFTVFIKNFIEFPTFGVKHKNMVDNLKSCIFHPKHNPDCPIFSIDYIMNEAEKNATERDLMLRYGGVIRIKLEWDCNLDYNIKLCKPEYSFARLDVPYAENPFSVGFNFRFASAWKHKNDEFRILTKVYGLRLIICISGKAGKFDLITLSLNIGSLVGIFGLATFICDIVLLYVSENARIYRNHVFEIVHLRTRFDSALCDSKQLNENSGEPYLKPESDYKVSRSNRFLEKNSSLPLKDTITASITSLNPETTTC